MSEKGEYGRSITHKLGLIYTVKDDNSRSELTQMVRGDSAELRWGGSCIPSGDGTSTYSVDQRRRQRPLLPDPLQSCLVTTLGEGWEEGAGKQPRPYRDGHLEVSAIRETGLTSAAN